MNVFLKSWLYRYFANKSKKDIQKDKNPFIPPAGKVPILTCLCIVTSERGQPQAGDPRVDFVSVFNMWWWEGERYSQFMLPAVPQPDQ